MRVEISEQVFTDQDKELFQDVLKEAYDKNVRPLCLCSHNKPPLYIAKVKNTYYLKRMPGTGQLHDIDCTHFEVSPLLSGRGNYENSAIVRDAETDSVTLKLGFSMSQSIQPSSGEWGSSANKNTSVANSGQKRMNLKGLLDFIYDEAKLTRYYPAMNGKRWYGIIEREMMKAVAPLKASRKNLKQAVFFPKYVKRDEGYEQNNMAMATFIDGLAEDKGKRPTGFVIGELHALYENFNRPRMVLKLVNTGVELEPKLYERVVKFYGTEIHSATDNKDQHFIVIARVHNEQSHLLADQVAGMLVDEHWIPTAESGVEELLMTTLYEQERSFERVLRYGSQDGAVLASVILIDTEEPTPVFILPYDAGQDESDEEEDSSDLVTTIRNEAPNAFIITPGKPFHLPPKRIKRR